MLFLGINAAYHESAAALLRGGRLIAAVEEERLTRVKHAKPARVDNADALPWAAIDACLELAGARLGEVDLIGYSLAPGLRRELVGRDPYPLADPVGWGSEAGEGEFERRARTVPGLIAARAGDPTMAERVQFLPHHLCHAASAFHGGPFESAAALVVDGIGERDTAWLGLGAKGRLEPLETIPYPHSVGLLWELVARWLGFTEYDAGKVMALAAHGDRDAVPGIDRLLRVRDPEGGQLGGPPPFEVDVAAAQLRGSLDAIEGVLGPRWRGEPLLDTPRFIDAAAGLQRRTEEALLAVSRRLARATGEVRLVYAGGVALNCVANARLEREGPFAEIYIPGPAHDAGTALGCALELARRAGEPLTNDRPLAPLVGPAFDGAAIDRAIEAAGLRAERVDSPEREAAARLASGQIVGWFQGRLELGPRALGNRSLLADPRDARSRDLLNRQIKGREPFQPFAASCLAEAAADWFVLPPGRAGAAASRELMLLAYPVRAERAARIPAVVHVDGSCRVQTVHQARQPLYHALIAHFAELTGVPLVVNTSFNHSEPIVGSPRDALATFARTGIDALFLGDRLVVR